MKQEIDLNKFFDERGGGSSTVSKMGSLSVYEQVL